MSRFINQLPKMRGREINEGLGTKIANKVYSVASNLARSSAYLPDKWALAWGRFAKDLASDIVEYVVSHRSDASLWDVESMVMRKAFPKNKVEKPVEKVSVEGVSVDYGHYIAECRKIIETLRKQQVGFVDQLDKTGFQDIEFKSKPEVDALYRILKDSFVPEKSESAKPAAKPTPNQKFSNVYEMIGAFCEGCEGGKMLTKRIVQLMFEAAVKMGKKGNAADPVEVARVALQGVGSTNAARSVQ